jgi:hypothetical protein
MLSVLIVLNSCTTKNPYTVVTIHGKGTVCNNSKTYIWVNSKADSLHPVSLLVEQGDALILEDNILYYKNTDEKNIIFKNDKHLGYINGKINSITIPNEGDLLPWLAQMKEADITDLQTIVIIDSIPAVYIPYLTQISKIKPDIGLIANSSVIHGLLKLFSPSHMVVRDLKQIALSGYTNLQNLEFLEMTLDDSIPPISLPEIPGLKQLIIPELKSDLGLSKDFLINNPQIERLTLCVEDSFDISFIKPLKNLKQLSVCGFKTLEGISVIEKYKHLETLILVGEKLKDYSVINKLHELRWLTLPVSTSQNDFNSIIENHSNLEVLEIIKNDSIKDLRPLLKLNKLVGLTLTGIDSITDFNTLTKLQQLKFLSIPVDMDSVKKTLLKQSLPNCTIATNEGFCLGSGWLLLLFPFILLFALFFRRKEHNAK